VISLDGLGAGFDVQGGGVDLLFPHHEMSSSHVRLLDDGDAAHHHVHAALVAYDGEKMSKSRGNLVFVSRLRADGVDPMVIRLAILAHHYRTPWEWTDADLAAAGDRLGLWRAALAGNGGPDATSTLTAVRAALRTDLDAPAALAALDDWARRALVPGAPTDWVEGAPGVVARTLDALLGVRV
jgi:L-cysteine:1D-myo-inositol 2-amino-2-deoxy-alpha-D-glucopyranoside ligase